MDYTVTNSFIENLGEHSINIDGLQIVIGQIVRDLMGIKISSGGLEVSLFTLLITFLGLEILIGMIFFALRIGSIANRF